MNDFERAPKCEEELEAQEKELMRRIFEPIKREVRLGTSVPSEEVIAEYYAELEAMQAAHILLPEDDLFIAA